MTVRIERKKDTVILSHKCRVGGVIYNDIDKFSKSLSKGFLNILYKQTTQDAIRLLDNINFFWDKDGKMAPENRAVIQKNLDKLKILFDLETKRDKLAESIKNVLNTPEIFPEEKLIKLVEL